MKNKYFSFFSILEAIAVILIFLSTGCNPNSSSGETEVKLQISRPVETADNAISSPLIDPSVNQNVGVLVRVSAPDLPRPIFYTFPPDEINRNKGVLIMLVPTGFKRTFWVEAYETYTTSVDDQFPGKAYIPKSSEEGRTVDLTGIPVVLNIDMQPQPTRTVTGAISDRRTGTMSPLEACATPGGGSVYLAFFNTLRDNMASGTVRVNVTGGTGAYTLANVPLYYPYRIIAADQLTGAVGTELLEADISTAPAPLVTVDFKLFGASPPAMTPDFARTAPSGSALFTASGGVKPYSFSMFSDTTGGATIDPPTGTYTAGPLAGATRINMTDACSDVGGANVVTVALAQCNDGIDNDGDGLYDMADTGCHLNSQNSELSQCQDGVDNDFDGLIDWPFDPDCASMWGDVEGFGLGLGQCITMMDEDGDTFVDLADPGCTDAGDNSERGPAMCDDGYDNDGDHLVDYPWDPDCFDPSDTVEGTPVTGPCNDGSDNDGDTLIDYGPGGDPGCYGPADISERSLLLPCDDAQDNDGDNLKDYPADPDCSSPLDPSEFHLGALSGRVVDWKGQGLVADIYIDSTTVYSYSTVSKADGTFTVLGMEPYSGYFLSAVAPGYRLEYYSGMPDVFSAQLITVNGGLNNPLPELITLDKTLCNDGLDSDGWNDGGDVGFDPGCSSIDDDDETDPSLVCDNGIDDDYDGKIDVFDTDCTGPVDMDEMGHAAQCEDGIDNDNDGLIDYNRSNVSLGDPGCTAPGDNDERDPATGLPCDDGISNGDNDALADHPADTDCGSVYGLEMPQGNWVSGQQCGNGVDDDLDGLVDLADWPCSTTLGGNGVTERDISLSLPCDDGLDNDGDGYYDYKVSGGDPGCTSVNDTSENEGTSICDDGLDNDGDGYVDFPADPGCSTLADTTETEPTFICDDGLDNDGDTLTDFVCGPGPDAGFGVVGVDDNNDGIIDNSVECGWPGSDDENWGDPGCSHSDERDNSELGPNYQCDDGLDNDGDGTCDLGNSDCNGDTVPDAADPKCSSPTCDDELAGIGCG